MAFQSSFDPQEDMVSDINMTPLVDVMLVLLIIFILAMPVLTHHLSVELPRANGNASPLTITTVTVETDQSLRWNQTPISVAQMPEHLRQLAIMPNTAVQIAADRRVAFEQVAQVLALVQDAGIEQVAILTQAN